MTEIVTFVEDEFLPDYTPTHPHALLVENVMAQVEYWGEKLPWVNDWEISVVAAAPETGVSEMWIAPLSYIRRATIYVREDLTERVEDEADYDGVYDLQALVLHELIHLLLDAMRNLFYNWTSTIKGMPLPARNCQTEAEEPIVWILTGLLRETMGEPSWVPSHTSSSTSTGSSPTAPAPSTGTSRASATTSILPSSIATGPPSTSSSRSTASRRNRRSRPLPRSGGAKAS